MSKYGVFSDPHFPVIGLNTEIYSVHLRIQSECRKIRTRKNSLFGTFHADSEQKCSLVKILHIYVKCNTKKKLLLQISTTNGFNYLITEVPFIMKELSLHTLTYNFFKYNTLSPVKLWINLRSRDVDFSCKVKCFDKLIRCLLFKCSKKCFRVCVTKNLA